MLGYKDNIVVATHILANAGRMAAAAERPLVVFVTEASKAYLKSGDTRLSDILSFCEAVGKPNLLAIADKLTPKEAAAVLCRLDPAASRRQAKADPAWARARLAAVITGEETPAADATPCAQPLKTPPRSQRSVLGETDAFSARRREKLWTAN